MSEEEALFRFPNSVDLIESNLRNTSNKKVAGVNTDHEKKFAPRIDVYEYYEKGQPINGGVGLRAYVLDTGELLEPATKNPHYLAGLPLICGGVCSTPTRHPEQARQFYIGQYPGSRRSSHGITRRSGHRRRSSLKHTLGLY